MTSLLTLDQAPTWSWAAWQGAVKTASFVSDLDGARPQVTAYCDKSQSPGTDRSFLKLKAHCWKAKLSNNSTSEFRAREWSVTWTPPIFTESLIRFAAHKDVDRFLYAQHSEDASQTMEGMMQLDDLSLELPGHYEYLCMVLHSSRVYRKLDDESDEVQDAYGYYILVLRPSSHVEGALERIGVGVCVSPRDCLPYKWSRHAAPVTEYLLV